VIDRYASGRMTVDGTEYCEDLKIVRNRVIPNWWRKQGHHCGVDDIADVLSAKPDILVIGTGYASRLRLPDSVRKAVDERGIKLIAEDTYQAVEVFNNLLSKGKDVAGAFHLTC
jgi:hypothetical protein